MAQDSALIIIRVAAICGVLIICAIAIVILVPWSMREKIAKLEARTKERLALIEKGYDPEQIFKEKKGEGNGPLFWACLLAGLGLGVFLGYMLSVWKAWDRTVMMNSLGIFFGAVGMIAYNAYERWNKKRLS